jgi:hypothetical protein
MVANNFALKQRHAVRCHRVIIEISATVATPLIFCQSKG